MAEAKAKQPVSGTVPVEPKSVPKKYVNVSDATLYLTNGVFQPGEEVNATDAEISTLWEFIQEKE